MIAAVISEPIDIKRLYLIGWNLALKMGIIDQQIFQLGTIYFYRVLQVTNKGADGTVDKGTTRNVHHLEFSSVAWLVFRAVLLYHFCCSK